VLEFCPQMLIKQSAFSVSRPWRDHVSRLKFSLTDAICTYDPLDPTAASPSIREQAFSLTSQRISSSSSILPGLRVGVPQEYFPAELAPGITESIRDVIKDLKSQGATIIPISLPSTSYALSSYYVLASAEASSNLSRYDGIEYGML